MASEDLDAPVTLVQLPDPCLLAVLQYCAADDDHRSLFNAARAHSRLHQATVAALHSVTVVCARRQQHADSVLQYLSKHGSRIGGVHISAVKRGEVVLRQLPPNLQLTSLQFDNMCLQLKPDNGFQGVLGAPGIGALKQLRLNKCSITDIGRGAESSVTQGRGLVAALSLAAGLEHLSISDMRFKRRPRLFPTAVLPHLQHLTSLELVDIQVQPTGNITLDLQPMQALSRLAALRLDHVLACENEEFDDWIFIKVTPSMLSSMHHLTRLELPTGRIHPDAIANKPELQHLTLGQGCSDTPEQARLLSHLQPLQLTHLNLFFTKVMREGDPPIPAAAFSALTASNMLCQLDIDGSIPSACVWQHMFHADRQLQNLEELKVSWLHNHEAIAEGYWSYTSPPLGRLVSCCPNLRSLDIGDMQYDAHLLVPLQGLSRLHTLRVAVGTLGTGVQALCQLLGLEELHVSCGPYATAGLTPARLVQLTQLQQLTTLSVSCRSRSLAGAEKVVSLSSESPNVEPVWRQLARLHLSSSDPEVAQQAAAALAE